MAGTFALIAATTRMSKPTANERTKRMNGTREKMMTLQKAIELVDQFIKDTGHVCNSQILDAEEADNMREFDKALMMLLETAKDVLRCENDGK